MCKLFSLFLFFILFFYREDVCFILRHNFQSKKMPKSYISLSLSLTFIFFRVSRRGMYVIFEKERCDKFCKNKIESYIVFSLCLIVCLDKIMHDRVWVIMWRRGFLVIWTKFLFLLFCFFVCCS